VAVSLEAICDANVAVGTVLHPYGEDTNTTTGATRDEGAATSGGFMAHLHVFAVDGGTWDIGIQDSANGSTWADVNYGTAVSITAPMAVRLHDPSVTATLRRYVRYTASRTGGTAGDGITFALAYARYWQP
jgi:hypothetical protein